MRKKIVAILLIATMAMGITACGGSRDKKDDNTITVWCWDKTFNIFAMEEAAKIYQEDHQDVKIDIVEVGDVDVQSRLTTAGTSGDLSTLPDIFLMQDQAFQKMYYLIQMYLQKFLKRKLIFQNLLLVKQIFLL